MRSIRILVFVKEDIFVRGEVGTRETSRTASNKASQEIRQNHNKQTETNLFIHRLLLFSLDFHLPFLFTAMNRQYRKIN